MTAVVIFVGMDARGAPIDPLRDAPVTFTRDIAPILFQHCAACHQPEGHAPFSLLTYAEVRPRARQIAVSVKSRYMPPWKPDPGYGEFVGERRLTDGQIDVIERWIADGAHEGDRADLPPSPPGAGGWHLGSPDLIVDLPEYVLAGGGVDEFRNFVVPVAGAATRYVRGLEFHANSPNVHHANVFVDPTTASRQLDEEDPRPGYDGVIPYAAAFPDGHFLGWTPGQVAPLEPDAQAWRLAPGSSLLVQLHMMQSETPQRVHPSIGLYFAKDAPTRTPSMLRLGRQNLDIAPGDQSYLVEDSYVLPVDAQIQAIQPHAHYRAREVTAWATLPDGSRRWLVRISRWDFAWQDQYRYASPFWLPAGTRLSLEYVFDNSAANRGNPDSPPRRVVWGQRSSDEMADLWIQMTTRTEQDLTLLSAEIRRKMILEDIAGHEVELRSRPDSSVVHNDVATLYLEAGRPAQAVVHFEAVSRLRPDAAPARFNLAAALEKTGRDREALAQYREAVRLDGSYTRAVKGLANALLLAGDLREAIDRYHDAIRLDPDDPELYNNLGFGSVATGEVQDGIASLERALVLRPEYADAHYNLARALVLAAKPADAAGHFRQALRLRRDWMPALTDLAWLHASSADGEVRDAEAAIRLASHAVEISGGQDATALDGLAAAFAAAGRFEDARRTARAAQALPGVPAALLATIQSHLELYIRGQAVVVP